MSEYVAARHLLNPKTLKAVSSGGVAIPKKLHSLSSGNIPSSPTDNILSPCSKRLWGGKRIHSPDVEYSLRASVKTRKFPCPGKSLILGSSSQARQNVMNIVEWKYTQLSPNIDEKAIRCDEPLELPVKIAQAKAAALMKRLQKEGWDQSSMIITADQVVLYKQQIREKPENEEQAIEFLSSYSEDSVMTVSAVVVTHYPSGMQASNIDLATVYWKYIDDEVVRRVVAKGQVFQAAGGFCTEDPELNALIKGIDGTMDSVHGLPVVMTERLINEVMIKCDNFYASSGEGSEDKHYNISAVSPTRYNNAGGRSFSDDDEDDEDQYRLSMAADGKSASGETDGDGNRHKRRNSLDHKSNSSDEELIFGAIA